MPVWLQTVLSLAFLAVHGVAILTVLLGERRNPSATMAWLLAVVLLPVLGVGFWLMFGQTRYRRIVERSAEASESLARVLAKHRVADKLDSRGGFDARGLAIVALADRMASTPTSTGNTVELLTNAARTYRALLQAIEKAQDHVHVLFYIIQPDRAGEVLRDRLVARAREGVEVRVLVDGLGSMHLPADFWRPLEEAGGRAAVFKPIGRVLARFFELRNRDRIDFRNHRKVVVVDGRIGFTGGINIGREYLGLVPERGYWRDTHVGVEGPAALSLQETFARDWLTATGELLEAERYFPEPPDPADPARACSVSIIDSGPDSRWSPILHVYAQAIMEARRRVWITNPYFVPGQLMESALVTAALRGVDVRILVPRKGDSRLVDLAAAWWFVGLMEAGVRVYRYDRGFVHAKTMVVDDWLATIGSANMDMRSFHLNFELNAFVHGKAIARELAEEFEVDLRDATEYHAPEPRFQNLPHRVLSAIARLLSPML